MNSEKARRWTICAFSVDIPAMDETEAFKLWWKETAVVKHISDLSMVDPSNGADCVGIERTFLF